MTDSSPIAEAQHQVMDMSRSMMKFSWAMTMFGAQQAAHLMTLSRATRPGTTLASAFDAITDAVESQLGDTSKSAFKAGSAFALAPLEGVPAHELNHAMQKVVMQPAVFSTMKAMMPQMVASMSAFIPDREPTVVREECEAKMYVMQLVQDVQKLCPPRSVHVPLEQIVDKCYQQGSYPALWSVEGVGHELVESRKHRGEELENLLTSKEVDNLPDESLTMLHAGVGLGFAELALAGLGPKSATAELDAAIQRFIDDCSGSSRKGYLGCAVESLGLVARHFYGDAMVLALDERLAELNQKAQEYFWHGVGRAVYFSPQNMVPGLSSPWPGVGICERLSPHELARRNIVAGFAWGMTMVNLKQPIVLERLLDRHGEGFADSEAFSNGVCSSLIMRHDTTPDEEHVDALLAYEPTSDDPQLEELWARIVQEPATTAVKEYHPVLKERGLLGEVFRFQSLGDLIA